VGRKRAGEREGWLSGHCGMESASTSSLGGSGIVELSGGACSCASSARLRATENGAGSARVGCVKEKKERR